LTPLFEVSFALINTYFSILFTALLLVLQLFVPYFALVFGETQIFSILAIIYPSYIPRIVTILSDTKRWRGNTAQRFRKRSMDAERCPFAAWMPQRADRNPRSSVAASSRNGSRTVQLCRAIAGGMLICTATPTPPREGCLPTQLCPRHCGRNASSCAESLRKRCLL